VWRTTHGAIEFLTKQTTCASVLAKRTTSENHCQKGPALSGGTPGQAARGTCRHCHRRQGGAAYTIAGMWLGRLAVGGGGPCRLHHSRQAAEVAPAGWRHPGSQRALIFRQ
jgi:hypothetical protein